MPVEIVSALIAGFVSVIVSILAYVAIVRQAKIDRINVERHLERQLTERLYNLRLEYYPSAFKITEKLGKDNTVEVIKNIRKALSEWKSGEVGLILSYKARQSFYELNEAIKKNPEKSNSYSNDQIQKIWKLRNRFRGELRRDLGLLFDEEDEQKYEDILD